MSVSLRPITWEESRNRDLFPEPLRDWGFPYLDPEWTWIVESNHQPIALIITSFAGGMLVLWRVLSTPDAKRVHQTWFRKSLLSIMDNARLRGCVGYFSLFEDTHASEIKIARLLTLKGGILRPFTGSIGVGVLP